MIEDILIENRSILIAICVALIGALVAIYVHRISIISEIMKPFIFSLSSDIVALGDPRNRNKDAFEILQRRFPVHHDGFIKSFKVSGWLRKRQLRKAWKDYYGEEGEQDWWLPNEYSAIFSNQLKNTPENTKQLAIHRINALVKICSKSLISGWT